MDAVADAGFTRLLTLPAAVLAELGLGHRGINSVILADGSDSTLEVYGVTVLWDSQPREASHTRQIRRPSLGFRCCTGTT